MHSSFEDLIRDEAQSTRVKPFVKKFEELAEELQTALIHCALLRKAPLNVMSAELITTEKKKKVNDLKRWLAYVEKAQVTKPELKVQFADDEPKDPHETQEPSDSLTSPAKDAPAEVNPTDDHGPI